MVSWIRVEDRLPTNYEKCLVYTETGEIFSTIFQHKCFYSFSSVDDYEELSHINIIKNITHWMPLPKPPREET